MSAKVTAYTGAIGAGLMAGWAIADRQWFAAIGWATAAIWALCSALPKRDA